MTADEIAAELQRRVRLMADALEPVLEDMNRILAAEMRRQAGLTDHTLKQLAKAGHPYAVRGGGFMKQVRTSTGVLWRGGITTKARHAREIFALGHDIKLVHVQSQTLFNAIYELVHRRPNSITGVVGVDPTEVRYLPWIIKGTRKMIPRDFIGRAAVIAKPRLYAAIRDAMPRIATAIGAR